MQSYLDRIQLITNQLPPHLLKKPIEYVFTIGCKYLWKNKRNCQILQAEGKKHYLMDRVDEQDQKEQSISAQKSVQLFNASVQKDYESQEQLQQKKQEVSKYEYEYQEKKFKQIARRKNPKPSKRQEKLIARRQPQQHIRDSQAAQLESEEIEQQQMFQNSSSSSSNSDSSQPIDDIYPQNYDYDEDTNFQKYYQQDGFPGNPITKEQQQRLNAQLQQTKLYQKKWLDTLRQIPIEIVANNQSAFHIINRNYFIRLEIEGGKKTKSVAQSEDEVEGLLNDNSKSSKETVSQPSTLKRVMFKEEIQVIRFRESDEVNLINQTDLQSEKLKDYEKENTMKVQQTFQSIFSENIQPIINSADATTILSSWIRTVSTNKRKQQSPQISNNNTQQHHPPMPLPLIQPQTDPIHNNTLQTHPINQSEPNINSDQLSNKDSHNLADLVSMPQLQKEAEIQTIAGSLPIITANSDQQSTPLQQTQPK